MTPDKSSLAQCVMVLGTTSGAGKSWLTTALCRYYARQGLKVAPYKAQNMSNNARVVAGGLAVAGFVTLSAGHIQAQRLPAGLKLPCAIQHRYCAWVTWALAAACKGREPGCNCCLLPCSWRWNSQEALACMPWWWTPSTTTPGLTINLWALLQH